MKSDHARRRDRWESGVSEQPLIDHCLQLRRSAVICHPIKGGPAVTAEHSKIGRFSACLTPHEFWNILRDQTVQGGAHLDFPRRLWDIATLCGQPPIVGSDLDSRRLER
jgi:hypothetical protein